MGFRSHIGGEMKKKKKKQKSSQDKEPPPAPPKIDPVVRDRIIKNGHHYQLLDDP
jgi:hypothetical protein